MDSSPPEVARKRMLSPGGVSDALLDVLKNRNLKADAPRSSKISSSFGQIPVLYTSRMFPELGGRSPEAPESSQGELPTGSATEAMMMPLHELGNSSSSSSSSVMSPPSAAAFPATEIISSAAEFSPTMPLLESQGDHHPRSLKHSESSVSERSATDIAFERFRNMKVFHPPGISRPNTAPGSLPSGANPKDLSADSSSNSSMPGVTSKASFHARLSSTEEEIEQSKLDAQKSQKSMLDSYSSSSASTQRGSVALGYAGNAQRSSKSGSIISAQPAESSRSNEKRKSSLHDFGGGSKRSSCTEVSSPKSDKKEEFEQGHQVQNMHPPYLRGASPQLFVDLMDSIVDTPWRMRALSITHNQFDEAILNYEGFVGIAFIECKTGIGPIIWRKVPVQNRVAFTKDYLKTPLLRGVASSSLRSRALIVFARNFNPSPVEQHKRLAGIGNLYQHVSTFFSI